MFSAYAAASDIYTIDMISVMCPIVMENLLVITKACNSYFKKH